MFNDINNDNPTQSSSEMARIGTEQFGFTEVHQVEVSEFLPLSEMLNYINDNIPEKHLEGCRNIRYEVDQRIFENSENLAYIQTQNHDICLGSSDRFLNKENLFEIVCHEIGHNVFQQFSDVMSPITEQWNGLHNKSQGGVVSSYAQSSSVEDFALTYETYITDPEYLRMVNPEKYEFMRVHVFLGREYEPQLKLNEINNLNNLLTEPVSDGTTYRIQPLREILDRPNVDIGNIVNLVSEDEIQRTARQTELRFSEDPLEVRMNMVAFD